MEKLTKAEIDRVMEEIAVKITERHPNDFVEAIEQLPDDLKNNPLMYDELAIATAIANVLGGLKEILYRLFT